MGKQIQIEQETVLRKRQKQAIQLLHQKKEKKPKKNWHQQGQILKPEHFIRIHRQRAKTQQLFDNKLKKAEQNN